MIMKHFSDVEYDSMKEYEYSTTPPIAKMMNILEKFMKTNYESMV